MDLSKKQKEFISGNHEKITDLTELTRATFEEDNLDGRTKEGRAVRAYLVEMEMPYETKHVYPKEGIELTEDQREFALKSAEDGMDSVQIASIIFSDRQVKRLSREFWAVHNFLEEYHPDEIHASEDAITKKWTPPKATSKVIKKINDYCLKSIDEDKLAILEKKGIEALGSFLASPRLVQVINTYDSTEDRVLFEAEFVRATWDKHDLTSDEINLYINVCMDYIHLKNIQGAINKLNRMFDDTEDQRDLTVRLAEILKTKSEEYNQCEKRMESLIQKLQGDRSKRISSKQKQNASILALVQLFQEEEERVLMVKMAEMQKKLAKKETGRIESMPDWKARVLGISKGDVI
jgi:phage gpG-like protein